MAFSSSRIMMGASTSGTASWAAWDGSQDGSNATVAGTSNAGVNSPVIVRMSDTKIALFDTDTGNNLLVTIGTLSGTTITWDDANQATVATSETAGGLCAALLDTDKLIVFYYASTQCRSKIVTTSGTVPTVGTATVVSANNVIDGDCFALTVLSTTSAIAIYRCTAGAFSGNIAGSILSVSGTTITANTEAAVIASAPTLYNVNYYASGKLLVTYVGASSYPRAAIVNYSGTTIGTLGTAAILESVVNESYSLCAAPMSASTAVVTYGNLDGGTILLRGVVVSLSGDTVTVNTPATVNSARASGNMVIALNTSQAMVAYHKTGVGTNVFAKVITITGTTVSAGSEITIQAINEKSNTPTLAKLTSNYVAEAVTTNGSAAGAKILKRA